ncbi:hypothetical protein INT45_008844 [Circinella minor]|uniref:Uncharacterized protein n=1 Tax=Circinella minor TaxID=1195481 RepID=A0A8H7S0Y4_9FUNG|nr:hypothetical protein INT45_008844 [Circinella minor]
MVQHQQRRDTLRKEHRQYYNRHDAVIRERNRKDAQLDQDIYDLLVACSPATTTTTTTTTNEDISSTTTTTTIVTTKEEDNENDHINGNKSDNNIERVQRRRRRSPTTPLTMTQSCTWLPLTQYEAIKSSSNKTNKSKSNNNYNSNTTTTTTTTTSSSLPSSPLSRSVTFNDNVEVVMF